MSTPKNDGENKKGQGTTSSSAEPGTSSSTGKNTAENADDRRLRPVASSDATSPKADRDNTRANDVEKDTNTSKR